MNENIDPATIKAGVVGLGLMGSSIAVALLVAGHHVVAIAPLRDEEATAPSLIKDHLLLCDNAGLLVKPIDHYLENLQVSGDYALLSDCSFVLECVIEKLEIKAEVYGRITAVISPSAILASNTSAIPISILQKEVSHPERFLGIHWAEPAYMTRFLEITCGANTDMTFATYAFDLAHYWNKEPTLLKKDIRGFVTNRLMYAVYREGLALEEKGEATVADMDKVFQYDAGSWMTLMGIFRRMDYMGLEDLEQILENILPQLSNTNEVAPLMQKLIALKAKGTQTSGGFYPYQGDEAKEWEESFAAFNKDIDELAAKYPSATKTYAW